MVQQLNRSSLEALRLGQATDELNRIRSTPYDTEVALDFETTGLNPRVNQMVMVQLKPKGKKPLIIDARGEDRGALHSALLPLVTDARRVFTGQNLLFELSWLLTHLGFEVDDLRATFSDTMLRELVILGMGYNDAYKKGLAVDMHALGETYGIQVHKEERKWFPDLDQRPEWFEPFPEEILGYARQDVSVVHLISAKQQELIDEYELQGVVDLEARIVPATSGMQHYGMAIDREKWLEIMAGIDEKAEELAAKLHVEVDVSILEHRRQMWQEKMQPYQEWKQAQKDQLDVLKYTWEQTGSQLIQDYGDGTEVYKGWGDYKLKMLKRWEEEHPKPTPPPALKDGANLNSPAQILVAFRARGHQLDSVKEDILTPLVDADPVVALYLEYQDYATARKKYGPKFLETFAPDGVIRASVQQLGTETGRYAFEKPNVQQTPARGAGARLREAFVAGPGRVLLDFDFTNVELMIAAWITRDPVMLKAFADREDLHARTAEVMFDLKNNPEYVAALASGVTPKAWTDGHLAVINGKTLTQSYRAIAKTINFGLLYGMGAYRLAAKLRIDVEVAKVLMRLYRETYKVAVAWLKRQGERIERPDKDGRVYAKTLLGRRRWFDVPKLVIDKNATAEEAQEALYKHKGRMANIQRQLANHPIQGTSADITKWAIALWQERYNGDGARLICTVHDELILEVLDDPGIVALAQERLGEVMHRALTHFLTDMDIPIPSGKPSDHWQH